MNTFLRNMNASPTRQFSIREEEPPSIIAIINISCHRNLNKFRGAEALLQITRYEGKPTSREEIISVGVLVPLSFGSGTVCRWMEGADAPRCKSRINLANPSRGTDRSGLPLTPIAARGVGRRRFCGYRRESSHVSGTGVTPFMWNPSTSTGLRHWPRMARRYLLYASIGASWFWF